MNHSSWQSFGYSVSRSRSLKRISFDETEYNELDFVALSPILQGTLLEFNTTNGRFGEYELEVLSKLWRIDSCCPDHLNFSNNDIDPYACQTLSLLIRKIGSPFTLQLASNDLQDKGVEYLFGNRMNYANLTTLNLKDTNITDTSCDLLTNKVLMNKSIRLKLLLLDDNGITNNGFGTILRGLVVNKHLKFLSIANTYVTTSGWNEMLKKLLCNTSSIDNTYLSNHCLEVCIPPKDYYLDSESGKMIMQMLQVNTKSKKGVALTPKKNNGIKPEAIAGAHKVLQSHLINLYHHHESCILSIKGGEGEDDDKMIPYVFEWMTMNKNDNNSFLVTTAFYHICKHKSHLFELAKTRYSNKLNGERPKKRPKP